MVQYLGYYLRSVEFCRVGCGHGCCQEAELHISAQVFTRFNCMRQPCTTCKIKIRLQFGISVLDFPVASRIVQTTKTRNNPLGNNNANDIRFHRKNTLCMCTSTVQLLRGLQCTGIVTACFNGVLFQVNVSNTLNSTGFSVFASKTCGVGDSQSKERITSMNMYLPPATDIFLSFLLVFLSDR